MKLKIFSLRDQKIDAFMAPLAMQTTGQVIRMLQDEIERNEPTNIVAKHTEDFELFEVGEFDTDTGQITAKAPKSVILLTELKPKT